MKEKPLVSIITPCYNSENYILRYIDLILKQTYKELELIFINDGSTDNTENILLEQKDRIEKEGIKFVYCYQENKGLGSAINSGLKRISGKYFTWCDSDNFYDKTYFEKKVIFFELNPECSVLRCGGNVVKEGNINEVIGTLGNEKKEKNNKNMFYNCLLNKDFHFGCAMLRTESFDNVNPKRDIYESREGQNWQLMLPMLYKYDSYYICENLFTFVHRDDSVSNKTSQEGIVSKLKQIEEYQNIIITTIKSMKIQEEQKCIELIVEHYEHIKLQVAKQFCDKELLIKIYFEMKSKNILKLKDRIIYFTARIKLK